MMLLHAVSLPYLISKSLLYEADKPLSSFQNPISNLHSTFLQRQKHQNKLQQWPKEQPHPASAVASNSKWFVHTLPSLLSTTTNNHQASRRR
jgi:hypothetical protein